MVNSSLDQATQDKEALKAWESARRAKQNFGCSETRAVGCHTLKPLIHQSVPLLNLCPIHCKTIMNMKKNRNNNPPHKRMK